MKPRTLLRLYPRAWRERYGEELLAMIGRDVQLRGAADIARSAVRERGRVHGPLAAFVLMAVCMLPGVALVSAAMSGLATLMSYYLHLAFGVVPMSSSMVRVIWMVAAFGTLIFCFRDRATTRSVVRFVGVVFFAAVLSKWLHNTWLHPFHLRDFQSWDAPGRGDALMFGILVLEIWLRGLKKLFRSIDLTPRARRSV